MVVLDSEKRNLFTVCHVICVIAICAGSLAGIEIADCVLGLEHAEENAYGLCRVVALPKQAHTSNSKVEDGVPAVVSRQIPA